MPNDRDKRIIESLSYFTCMTSSQLAKMHCSTNKNPKTVINRILKRLRSESLISCDTSKSFSDYIYFPINSPIRKRDPKIKYHLEVVDAFLKMNECSPVTDYQVEKHLGREGLVTSLQCHWLDKDWFVEVSSLYSVNKLNEKMKKYKQYKDSGKWKNLNLTEFPSILILDYKHSNFNKTNYDMDIEYLSNDNDLKLILERYEASKMKKVTKKRKKLKR